MSKLLITLAVVIGLSACTSKPKDSITAVLTTSSATGVQTSWSQSCKYNEYSCNPDAIRNARTMFMGDDVYYTCSISGDLYMSRNTYRTSTSLTLVNGMSCKYTVIVTK